MESLPSIPFRSKKPSLQATPKKMGKLSPEDPLAMLETPEKSSQPSRVRNQNIALSVKDVKRTAQMLQKESDSGSEPLENSQSRSSLPMSVLQKGQRSAMEDVDRSVKLPEKCLMLCEFFNAIVNQISLLSMRRRSPTFTNISSKIESQMNRSFTIKHLAQLKYILPEAILVKRIRIRDDQTDCMKEDLQITLDRETVKPSKNVKDIKEMFQSRIEDYYEAHKEENDIPEGELPPLFSQSYQNETSSIDKSSCVAAASHLSQCFRRSFSRQVPNEKLDNPTVQGAAVAEFRKSLVSESSPLSNVLATPVKNCSAGVPDGPFTVEFSAKEANSSVMKDGSEGSICIYGTPSKEASTPVRLMASTPAIQPSKRCYMSPDDDTCDVPTKLLRRSNRTRSLKFDPPEDNAATEDDALGSNVDSNLIDLFPENRLQSVIEKESEILEEQDPAISQARRRHHLVRMNKSASAQFVNAKLPEV